MHDMTFFLALSPFRKQIYHHCKKNVKSPGVKIVQVDVRFTPGHAFRNRIIARRRGTRSVRMGPAAIMVAAGVAVWF